MEFLFLRFPESLNGKSMFWLVRLTKKSIGLADVGSRKVQLEFELEFNLHYLICKMGAISAFFNIRLMECREITSQTDVTSRGILP